MAYFINNVYVVPVLNAIIVGCTTLAIYMCDKTILVVAVKSENISQLINVKVRFALTFGPHVTSDGD